MKKRFLMVFGLLFVTLATNTQAQLSLSSNRFKTGNKMVECAIMNGVRLLDHSYQLFDTTRHMLIGRAESEVYGHTYSLGIITDGAMMVNDFFVSPWNHDSTYQARKGFVPRSYMVNQRALNDTTFHPMPLDTCIAMNGSSYYTTSIKGYGHGFFLDYQEGTKHGFFVFFVAPKPVETSPRVPFVCNIIEKELQVSSDTNVYNVPSLRANIVGGLYLEPCYEEAGSLTFQLVGIMEKIDGAWKLRTFNK